MQTNLKIERVIRDNSPSFAIYEYTKLVTILDNYLAIRALQRQHKGQTMYPIPQQVEKVITLNVSGNNIILCLQKIKIPLHQQQQNSAASELQLSKYEDGDRKCTRLSVKATNLLSCSMGGQYALYAFQSAEKDFTQLLLIHCQTMRVKASAFLPDKIKGIELLFWGETVGVSLLLYNGQLRILQYAEEDKKKAGEVQIPATAFSLARSLKGFTNTILHRYLDNQFMIAAEDKTVKIYKNYDNCQTIDLHGNIDALEINSFGFFVFVKQQLLYYRQKRVGFQLQLTLPLEMIQNCQRMEVSPSDNLIILQDRNRVMVSVWVTNEEKTDLSLNDIMVQIESTARKQLVCLAVSPSTNYFATIQKMPYTLCVYDFDNDNPLSLNYQLSNEEDAISDCCFHPTIPFIAIAFKNQIKFYCLLFSQMKEVKQLPLNRPRKVFFSNSGLFLCCMLGRGKGCKILLYDAKSNFHLIETLWLGNEPLEMFWSQFDNHLYVVLQSGLLAWSVEDTFREKKEIELPNCKIKGGFYDVQQQAPVIIAQDCFIKINKEVIKLVVKVNQVLPSYSGYLMACQGGTILNGKELEVGAVSHQKLNIFRSDIKVQRCRSSIICTSPEDQIVLISDRQNHSKPLNTDIVFADRKTIVQSFQSLQNYEKQLKELNAKMESTVEELRKEFQLRQLEIEKKLSRELQQANRREEIEKQQKHLLQKLLSDNREQYEKEQFKALAELEKLYERKLALTYNKQVTAEQINIRNVILAQKNLEVLSQEHHVNIQKIRQEYIGEVQQISDKQSKDKDKEYKIHAQYHEKILQVEDEYETVLKDIQLECQTKIREEKRFNINWETRFRTCQSEKSNLEISIKSLREEKEQLEKLLKKKEENNILYERKLQIAQRDNQQLLENIKETQEKMVEYEYKIKDLEKAKEILTFRVLETRNLLQPKEKQLIDSQDQLAQLEEQLEKYQAECKENKQKSERLKKELQVCRRQLADWKLKEKACRSDFQKLINKIFEIVNHSSTEEWNRSLLKLHEEYCQNAQHRQSFKYRSKDTVQELSRMKTHLQHCLDQVITSNVKIQQRKAQEFTKKTYENAQLLSDVNELRRHQKSLKAEIDQKNLEIERLKSQQVQHEINSQKRIKTEGGQERHRSKFLETRKTFYRCDEHDSTAGFTTNQRRERIDFLQSSQSKRVASAQKGTVRRGKNFSRSFRIDMQVNRKFEQEQQLKEARRQLQIQEQLIMELRMRLEMRN